VWTSAGVLVGVDAVALTGWQPLDPIVALLVAANIIRAGTADARFHQWTDGLRSAGRANTPPSAACSTRMPRRHSIPRAADPRVRGAALRVAFTCSSGRVDRPPRHALLERIEADIESVVQNVTVLTHLESLDDPSPRGTTRPSIASQRTDKP
jgi:hypothetical protein